MTVRNGSSQERRTGLVLPFQPLSLAFNHVDYYVDMPAVSQSIPSTNIVINSSVILHETIKLEMW